MKKIVLIVTIITASIFAQLKNEWEYEAPPDLIINDIFIDYSGYVYLTGFVFNSRSSKDIALIKIDKAGHTAWEKTYQASYGNDAGNSIVVDNTGSVFISGIINDKQIRTIRYNADGELVWEEEHSIPSFTSTASLIKMDGKGNILTAGECFSSLNNKDIILAKYNYMGNLLWSATLDIDERDKVVNIFFDRNDNIFICGLSSNANNISSRAYLAKYTSEGDFVFQKELGNYQIQYAAADKNFIFAGGKENKNISIKKINFEGDLLWSRVIEGNELLNLTSSKNGLITVTDFSAIKLNSFGAVDWEKKLSSTNSPAVDGTGNIYFFPADNERILQVSSTGEEIFSSNMLDNYLPRKIISKENNIIVMGANKKTGSQSVIKLTADPRQENKIEVSNLNAELKEGIVKLSWSALLGNTTYLEILRKTESGNWEVVGTRRLNTPSAGSRFFSLEDNIANVEKGNIKYRIKFFKPNGETEFSDILNVAFNPVEHQLFQNYPNPFNPATSISFKMAKPGRVSLKVYNVLGNEVETLVDGYRAEGIYEVVFNAGDLSSGIYFYKLITDDFIATKKMTYSK